MKRLSKLIILFICCVMLYPKSVYATETVTQGSIDEDTSDVSENNDTDDNDTDDNDADSSDTDNDDDDIDSDNIDDFDDEPSVQANSKIMLCDNWEIPTVTYGHQVNIVLPLVNMDKYDVTDVIISPVISTDTASFPFEIEKTGYAVELTELLGSNYNSDPLERRQEVTYTFRARDDIITGYYEINFNISFTNVNGSEETATITTYVKAIGKKGSGNGSGAVSVPRIIITGFETNPENVHAGDDFTLTLHIKNTSENTAVSNIKCDLQAATDAADENEVTEAFLPKQGSSTLFMDNIGEGETKDVSIDMNAKASLTQKPYVLNVTMDYEDESYNQYSSEASVSIPVLQEARFELSDPEVMPASIEVGSESNIMFSIYNTGKTTMYNVAVKFQADSISGGDTYVGKIQTGETGNVDAMVTGEAATADDGTVKILITYEDEAGNPTTVEKSLNLNVSAVQEVMPDDIGVDMSEEDIDDNNSVLPWVIAGVILLIVAAAATIIVLKIRKKKKNEMLENELLADIDDEYPNEDDIDSIYDQTENIDEESIDEESNAKAPQKEGDDDEIS